MRYNVDFPLVLLESGHWGISSGVLMRHITYQHVAEGPRSEGGRAELSSKKASLQAWSTVSGLTVGKSGLQLLGQHLYLSFIFSLAPPWRATTSMTGVIVCRQTSRYAAPSEDVTARRISCQHTSDCPALSPWRSFSLRSFGPSPVFIGWTFVSWGVILREGAVRHKCK